MKNKKNTKFVILAGVVFIVIASVGLLYVNDVNVVEIVISAATGNPFEITEVTAERMTTNYMVFIHIKNNGDDTHLVEDATITIDGNLISQYRWLSESYWFEPGQTITCEVMLVPFDNSGCIDVEWSLDGHTSYYTCCL